MIDFSSKLLAIWHKVYCMIPRPVWRQHIKRFLLEYLAEFLIGFRDNRCPNINRLCELQAVPQVLHSYQTWVVRMPGVFRGWGTLPALLYTMYWQPHVNTVIQ